MTGSAFSTTMAKVTGKGVTIQSPGQGGGDLICYGRVSASGWSTPWVATCRMVYMYVGALRFPSFGILMQDTAGKIEILHVQGTSGTGVNLYLDHYSDNKTIVQHWYTGATGQTLPNWFRVGYDGTNLYWGISYDGIYWNGWFDNTYLGTIAYVGIGGDNSFYNTSNGPPPNPATGPSLWGALLTYWDDPSHPASSHIL
jgi:hypothetical protein